MANKFDDVRIKILEALGEMTDEERLEIFSNFCTYCGSTDPSCQCWNDE